MSIISNSVGYSGKNRKNDVKIIQKTLNTLLMLIPKTKMLVVDGIIGSNPDKSKTVAAIREFQSNMIQDFGSPSGTIEPNSVTLKTINTYLRITFPGKSTHLPPITVSPTLAEEDYVEAAQIIGCDIEEIKAVAYVETKGKAFFPSGRPAILFEPYQFSLRTGHIYCNLFPLIATKSPKNIEYGLEKAQYHKLLTAMVLDRKVGLQCASWGRFQIMGFNFDSCGYSDVESFVKDMFLSEKKQLIAFTKFVRSKGLSKSLKNHDWTEFAEGYNGRYQRGYDARMEAAYLSMVEKK
ncbi:N-acetylmuramidase domain-containing protein [Marinomonas gallaica]|uniref:N-acetylmuramidase domain-containing protein n=1 Tax=Marinomonas gallaica TaxID=1806667 RepID=UPI003CE44BF7